MRFAAAKTREIRLASNGRNFEWRTQSVVRIVRHCDSVSLFFGPIFAGKFELSGIVRFGPSDESFLCRRRRAWRRASR